MDRLRQPPRKQRTYTRAEVLAKISHILAGEETSESGGTTTFEVRHDGHGRYTRLDAYRPERFL